MKKITRDKIRTRCDFSLYFFERTFWQSYWDRITIILGLLGFIIAIVAYLNDLKNTAVAAAIVGITIQVNKYIKILIKHKKHEEYELKRKNNFDITKIMHCEPECSSNRRAVEFTRSELTLSEDIEGKKEIDWVFMSHELNKYLFDTSNTLKLEMNSLKENQITGLIKDYWNVLSHYLMHKYKEARKNRRAFYNEKKLCMANGFSPGSDDHMLIVNCSKGGYYDTYLTNIIYDHYLRDKNGDDKSIPDAKDAFHKMKPYSKKGDKSAESNISESDTLRAYKNTKLNNEFGISTIAVTEDNYIYQVVQSDRAQSSGQLIAPSGSGSCDYDDIRGDDFRKTIAYAMQRELWEEAGFKCKEKSNRQKEIEDLGETLVIGFFRWLKRNGKPEMLGISRINKELKDIKPNVAEVKREVVLVEEVFNIDDLKEYLERIRAVINSAQHKKEYDGVSVPLLALVMALEELLKDTRIALKIEKFLFPPRKIHKGTRQHKRTGATKSRLIKYPCKWMIKLK